jgi:hypothetical protein
MRRCIRREANNEEITKGNKMCKFEELKEIARPIFRAVVLALPRDHSRSDARSVIRAKIDGHELPPADARFIADYMMSSLGYGGGF